MPNKAELAKAIARVESEIVELRIRLGKQKDALLSQGKRAVWNDLRAAVTKPLYDLLERRWALDLVKHLPSPAADVLYNVKVVGILQPETVEGAIISVERLINTDVMTKNGPMPVRTYDVVQIEADLPDVQPYELKSDAGESKKGVMASSVKGGLTDDDIEVHLRQKSPPGKQLATEKKLITRASKIPGAKILVKGINAVTGKVQQMLIDPRGLNLSIFTRYRSLPDVLTLRKPDPADVVPGPTDKPAVRKKPNQVIPSDNLGDDSDNKSAKKQSAKQKAGSKLTASRGVTAPSPNAPAEVAKNTAAQPPAKKQTIKRKVNTPVKAKTPALSREITPPSPNTPLINSPDSGKASDATLAAKAKLAGPPLTLPTTQPIRPANNVPISDKATVVTPSAPKIDAHPATGKGRFSLRLKISPKIKAIGGVVLAIGFDLFIGWLEGRRNSKVIKALLEENSNKFTAVVNAVATQEDFAKFRFGSNLEKGYQLYFQINLTVTRHCSDGGCGTSGRISDIALKEVNFSRTKRSDFSPDPQEEEGWVGSLGEATAVFYQPIFDNGIPVRAATEQAADGDLTEFYQTFVLREKEAVGDYTRQYFEDFQQYYKFFPDSQAGNLFLRFGLDDYLAEITEVEQARKSPMILMAAPHNLPFEEVLKRVRWGLASKMSFIMAFYELVIQLPPEFAVAYLERYDAYFKLMDSVRKCDYACHRMTGDRRITHRLTADDLRTKPQATILIPGSDKLIYLQNK